MKNGSSSDRPDIRDELLVELHAWQKDVGAVIPKPNPDWREWCDQRSSPLE